MLLYVIYLLIVTCNVVSVCAGLNVDRKVRGKLYCTSGPPCISVSYRELGSDTYPLVDVYRDYNLCMFRELVCVCPGFAG